MFDLQINQGIARLSLNRPKARNAISVSQWPLLSSAIDQTHQASARILLLSGIGSAFCAGADFSDFDSLRSDAAKRVQFRQSMREALDRLRHIPIPTVAIIEGGCFGAGVALAMACDFRIAGKTASFAVPPAKLGISYPQEDIHALVSLVGPGHAARLLFSGATIDGAEAARIGLVEHYEEMNVADAVERLVTAITANSAFSLAALKQGIGLANRGTVTDDVQDQAFDSAFGSKDLADRLLRLRTR